MFFQSKNLYKRLSSKYPNLNSVVIGASLIMFWRAIWGVLDLYVFPNDKLLSFIIPGLIGLLLLYLNDFNLKEIE